MARDIVLHNPTELTSSQLSAIAAIATGSNVTEAAALANVDRTTVHRWLSDDPLFLAMVNRSKQEAIDAIRAEVRAGAAEAIKVVREVMVNRASGTNFRLKAALSLLRAVAPFMVEQIGPTDPEDIETEKRKLASARTLDRLLS